VIFTPPPLPKQHLKYSWIPVSEIHTARTRIDGFLHLSPTQRVELHQKFASMVACLISQFDLIGSLDDESITPDQAAVLTSAFSDALVEIQRTLFQPIERQHTLDKRGPLYRPPTTFEGRKIRPRIKRTLFDVATNLRKRSANTERKGPELVSAQQEEEVLGDMLPPQYRVTPIGTLPEPNPRTFLEMSARVKAELEEADRRRRAIPKPGPPPRRRKPPEIITNPRPPPPPPPEPVEEEPKPVVRSESDPLSFAEVCHPENRYFDEGDYALEPIAGVSTGDCLEGINRLFAPLPVELAATESEVVEIEAFQMPEFEKPKEAYPEAHYTFQTSKEAVAHVIENDTVLIIVDEKQAKDEHEGLTALWEQLKLSPETRLRMAARLCTIVAEDVATDYHFQAIMGATTDFKNYNQAYRDFKRLLTYEPDVGSPEKATQLRDASEAFKVAENSFVLANKEMTTILGAEIVTDRGGISGLIAKRARKIRELKLYANLDRPSDAQEAA
jgi:hypothetical protein